VAVILDLYSRRVIDWAMRAMPGRYLMLDALVVR